MNDNKKNSPIFLLLILFLILFGLSLLTGDLNVFGVRIKVFDPFSDIKPDTLLSSQNTYNLKLNSSGFGLLLPITFYPTESVSLQGNITQMEYFTSALKTSKTEKVRIAHFGDSVIEGDLITNDFRNTLQSKFGGEGIGMVSVTADDIRFRVTVKHTFSDDWNTSSLVGKNQGNLGLGINGTVSIPSAGSWVKLESSGIPGAFKSIKNVFIYYSDAKNSSLKYSLNGGADKSLNLETGKGLKQLVISGEGAKSIKITAIQKEQARIYGISIESENGIIIDNFPLRGNSGISIRDISTDILKQFNSFLDYKLIILQFGLNMITSGHTDYDWYEKEMIKVINHLKSAFPETSLLLVSVGDKCIKKGTRLVTDPNITRLVNVQKKIAESTGIAFWNLFESMGGENSMLEWVNSKPPLAMKDYTHFNNEGAKKIGRMLSEAVLNKN